MDFKTTTAIGQSLRAGKVAEHYLIDSVDSVASIGTNLTISMVEELKSFSAIGKFAFRVTAGALFAKFVLNGVEQMFNIDLSGAQSVLDFIVNIGFTVVGIELAYRAVQAYKKASDERTETLLAKWEGELPTEKKSITGLFGSVMGESVSSDSDMDI